MNDYSKIFELIEESEVITIFGHMNPDGDCYGSEIGLREALRHFYPQKKVYAIGGGYTRVPQDFPTFDDVDDETIKKSLAIIVDLSNKARINDERAFLAQKSIKIDHHIFTEKFCDVEYIETDKVSCTQVLTNILLTHFDYLPQSVANPLFLGLVTDSGRFLYSPLDENVMNIASKLLSFKAETKKIYDTLYETDLESLRFKAYVYQNFMIDDGVAYMVFTKEQLKKMGMNKNMAAPQVNLISNIKGCFAWVFFAEGEDGIVRVELRSNGFPVQPIAVKFGGGGHLQASGCTLNDINDYVKVVEALKERYQCQK